jgi:hypothetical protein
MPLHSNVRPNRRRPGVVLRNVDVDVPSGETDVFYSLTHEESVVRTRSNAEKAIERAISTGQIPSR